MKAGRKNGHNGDQVPHQLFFWGEGLAIHHENLGSMTLAERFKPVVAKAHQAVLGANHQPFDLTKFNLFHDLVKAFALIVER